jgi:deoxycytidylate deaminase
MKRDAKASNTLGQRVSDAFYLSDFYINNTADQFIVDSNGKANPDWDVNDHLSRLIRIISHAEVIRPTYAETAMHEAYGAQLRSACLSRQVGAALVDPHGNVIATGTNEVPRAGGGVYGESLKEDSQEGRCALRTISDGRFCSNTRQQNTIIMELIRTIPELHDLSSKRQADLKTELRETRIGELLEFSRAVHAEMDALLTAARKGVTPEGARLFVTAFPCHYCARHIVAAGIDEVQYIEPYPKSQALALHSDAIVESGKDWEPPSKDPKSKVLFHPFVGVAPGLYRRAFLKDRELKDRETGESIVGTPEWGELWHLRKASYVQLEAELAKTNQDG